MTYFSFRRTFAAVLYFLVGTSFALAEPPETPEKQPWGLAARFKNYDAKKNTVTFSCFVHEKGQTHTEDVTCELAKAVKIAGEDGKPFKVSALKPGMDITVVLSQEKPQAAKEDRRQDKRKALTEEPCPAGKFADDKQAELFKEFLRRSKQKAPTEEPLGRYVLEIKVGKLPTPSFFDK